MSKVALTATTVLDAREERGSGVLTEQLRRVATISYRGKSGDSAEYVAVPRVSYAGSLQVTHIVPMSIEETGSWTEVDGDGQTTTGTCGGTRKTKPGQLETLFSRHGHTIKGELGLFGIDAEFNPACPIEPGLDAETDNAKISLPASKLRRRSVTIPVHLEKHSGGDYKETLTWSGAITLKLRAVCHTTACQNRASG